MVDVRPYTLTEIRDLADQVLRQYNPQNKIPTPIEEIVEYGFKLDIIPVEDLIANSGCAGYITPDLTTIYVDAGCTREETTRLGFTLGHELGHYLLHPDYVKSCHGNSIKGWAKKRASPITPLEYRFEEEANEFSGRILAPAAAVKKAWEDARIMADKRQMNVNSLGTYGTAMLTQWVARSLHVSYPTAQIALVRAGLICTS